MKHFIYLDTDLLNSYLSQIQDGLQTSSKLETLDQNSEQETETFNPSKQVKDFELGIKGLLKANFKTDKDFINTTRTLNQTESGRELIEKILHDNAFDNFKKYLIKNHRLDVEKPCEIGNYILSHDHFSVWDIEYLLTVFDKDMVDIILQQEESQLRIKLKEYKESLNRDQSRKAGGSSQNIENEIRAAKNESRSTYETYINIIKKVATMLPTDKFIIIDNFFVPLDQKYLRESVKNINFKYCEKITLVGKITNHFKNISDPTNEPNISDVFSSINSAIGTLYETLITNTENMMIVTPIALYFE